MSWFHIASSDCPFEKFGKNNYTLGNEYRISQSDASVWKPKINSESWRNTQQDWCRNNSGM